MEDCVKCCLCLCPAAPVLVLLVYLGAWPTLLAAISLLAGLCALIIDVGNLFACSAGVTEQLMAISLIAIGTCLPGTVLNL